MSKPAKKVSQRTLQRRLKAKIEAMKQKSNKKIKTPGISISDVAAQDKEDQLIGRVPYTDELDLEACLEVLGYFDFLATLGSDLVGLKMGLRTDQVLGRTNVIPWEVTLTTKHPIGTTTVTTCDAHPGKALLFALAKLRDRGGDAGGYTGSLRRVFEQLGLTDRATVFKRHFRVARRSVMDDALAIQKEAVG